MMRCKACSVRRRHSTICRSRPSRRSTTSKLHRAAADQELQIGNWDTGFLGNAYAKQHRISDDRPARAAGRRRKTTRARLKRGEPRRAGVCRAVPDWLCDLHGWPADLLALPELYILRRAQPAGVGWLAQLPTHARRHALFEDALEHAH